MYRTNIQRIMESAAHVAHALYSNEINYAEIITAYHHLTLECTGRKDEAVIVDQIITGYQRLQQTMKANPTTLAQLFAGINSSPRCFSAGPYAAPTQSHWHST